MARDLSPGIPRSNRSTLLDSAAPLSPVLPCPATPAVDGSRFLDVADSGAKRHFMSAYLSRDVAASAAKLRLQARPTADTEPRQEISMTNEREKGSYVSLN